MKYLIVFFSLLRFETCISQPVDHFINEAIAKNLALQQTTFSLEKAYFSLKEAKGMFLPAVNFQSDYYYAAGGRTIDMPLGDLLNPVYNSLNELTSSTKFPNIPNQQINLATNDFHDTRFNVTLPLINSEIYWNHKIKKEVISQRQAEIYVYKRQLVKEVKSAYYQIQKAETNIEILKNAGKLIQENLSLTESRVKIGKLLSGDALRLKSQINDNNSAITDAWEKRKVAESYLNFLCNNHLERVIAMEKNEANTVLQNNPSGFSVDANDELTAKRSVLQQTEYFINQQKHSYLPTVSTYMNAGYQGTYLKFNSEQQYLSGGVTLKWLVFNGFGRKNKINQATTDLKIQQSQLQEKENQLGYQQTKVLNEMNTAKVRSENTKLNLEYSSDYYRTTRLRYEQGLILLVELNDGFNQLISNQLTHQQAITDYLIKASEFEQITASYKFN